MARKAKAQTIEQDQAAPKSPEDIFRDHYPGIIEAKVAEEKATELARKARGVYRGTLKAFKKAGGNVDALTAALAVRNRDPDEVTREWRDINRYARLMNLPIGSQLGLFEDGETVATKAENDRSNGVKPERVTRDMLRAARKAGIAASGKNKFETDHPYEEGSPLHLAFAGGYRDDQKRRALKLGKGPAGNGAGEHAAV